jgi:uncharacterized repeat protein (TIGR01451 family)
MFIKFCNSLSRVSAAFLGRSCNLRSSLLAAAVLSALLSPAVAQAQVCTPGTFTWSVTKFGAHFDTLPIVQRLFDGLKTYTGDQVLRMHQPAAGVPNDLVIQFSSVRPVGTTITLYMENDDAEAMTAANVALLVASYNNTYAPGGTAPDAALFAHLDRNGSGAITAADFDVGGATTLNAASGDRSPMGVTLSFYNGNPAAGGVLVNRAYSPINTISPSVYSFDTVSTGAFTHVQVVSWADNVGDDPRVIELEVNKTLNNGTNSITTTCLQLAKAWGANSIAGNVASIGATTGGTNNTAAFTSTASTTASSTSVAVTVGNTITFPAETMSPGTLANYTTVRSCTANGGATANALSNTNGQATGTLVIGAGDAAKAIVCTYTNTKLPTVTLTKISNGSVGPFTFTGTNGWASQTITTVTSGTGVAGATQTLTAASTVTDISETLPAGYTLTSIVCTGLGAGSATPNLTSAPVGGIPAYSVRLDAVATVAGANIACTFTNTLSSVDLAITKTNNLPGTVDLANDTLVRGQTTTYRIIVTNNGPQSVTGAVVTDPAVAALTCTSLTCAGTACPSATPAVSALQSGLTLGTLALNSTVTLNLTCTVN